MIARPDLNQEKHVSSITFTIVVFVCGIAVGALLVLVGVILAHNLSEETFAGDGSIDNAIQPNDMVVSPDALYPGLQICVKYPHDSPIPSEYHDYTVMSYTYEMARGEDKGGMMDVVDLTDLNGTTHTITLAEMGIVRYPDQRWSSNFTYFGVCPNQA